MRGARNEERVKRAQPTRCLCPLAIWADYLSFLKSGLHSPIATDAHLNDPNRCLCI
jgi:hypothetical protein